MTESKRITIRIIFAILSIILILSTLTACTSSDEENILTYTKCQGGYEVSGTADTNEIIVIPSTYNGSSVVKISNYAFSGFTQLKEVVIPDSVTTIGENAFKNCTSLETVSMSNNLTTIEESAFYSCTYLKNIELPESLTTINEYAFSSCESLDTILIPTSVKTIEKFAFGGCNLLIIKTDYREEPSGWDASEETNSIFSWNGSSPVIYSQSINDLDEKGYAYQVIDGIRYIIYNKKAYVEDISSFIKDAYILETITYNNTIYNVSTINASSFDGVVETVFIPQYVDTIFASFRSDTITKIIVDADNPYFTTLDGALYSKDMSSLIYYPPAKTDTEFIIPSTVTTIESSALNSTHLTHLTISENVDKIDRYALNGLSNIETILFTDTKGWYYTDNETNYDKKSKGSSVSVESNSKNILLFATSQYDGGFSDYYWYKI
ncbi:MAG: leucine-rich repeat protein [Bacillota bacterium]